MSELHHCSVDRRAPCGLLAAITISLIGFTLIRSPLAIGQPSAPVPLLPAEGSAIITPTFSWLFASGAAYYEVEVGPQSDPDLVFWSDTTYNLNLTPTNARDFPNEGLYWRVRAYDGDDEPGSWSGRVSFDKHIPAPSLRSPPNHLGLAEPSMGWDPVQGAVAYKVELTTDESFTTVDETYETFNSSLTPVDAIGHGTYYWRVMGLDPDDHEGTPSEARVFTKRIPAPVLVSPSDGMALIRPTLTWRATEGATHYVVEIDGDPTFDDVDYTYTTGNLSLTPVDAIEHGTLYWRVTGLDADDHAGTPSAGWSFVKQLPSPLLVSPADGVTVTVPTMRWALADGATHYQVEVTTDPSFNEVDRTYATSNVRLTPKGALSAGTYHWRVRSVDPDDHLGGPSEARTFVLAEEEEPSGSGLTLQLPAEATTISTDPTFRWSRVEGAARYDLEVSKDPDFSPLYDSVFNLGYTSYTPYGPAGKKTYEEGTYYWRVVAEDGNGHDIATSEEWCFYKVLSVPLAGPSDNAVLQTDPTYSWSPVVGAVQYDLEVSKETDFSPLYDSVYNVEYTSHTPYAPPGRRAYQVGTYYWRVVAEDGNGHEIATSEERVFSKVLSVTLAYPSDEMVLQRDPTFRWSPVLGAERYDLEVSKDLDFIPIYDNVYNVEYTSYTPLGSSHKDTYESRTYYWRVVAEDPAGHEIATSEVRAFSKGLSVALLNPPDGSTIGSDPTFRWAQVVGAERYDVEVSKDADFIPLYDNIYNVEYTTYTPYPHNAQEPYDDDTYYWRVVAEDENGHEIATSPVRTFTKSSSQATSTPIGAPTSTPTPPPTETSIPQATVAPGFTPTPPDANPTAGPPPANKKTLGSVVVYADAFEDLGDNRWSASGHVRLGSAAQAYAELSAGTVTLDYGDSSIEGSDQSTVALLLSGGTAAPVFAGGFSVDAGSGALVPGGIIYQLARLGDLGVDIGTPLSDFSMNVLEGTVIAEACVSVYAVEGLVPDARVHFTLHHDGNVEGELGMGDLTFEAAALTFSVESASFSYSPSKGGAFTIDRASVALPDILSTGVGSEGSVSGLVITADGLEDVSGGSITLSLPDLSVPGTGGRFEVAGASVTMSLEAGGQYAVHGEAGFSLPNIASSGQPGQAYSGGLYAEFELDQDGLRYILMGGTVEPGIPIGQSGMALTGMEGEVTLRPAVQVQITGTIQSQLEVPPLGPVVAGEPSVWVRLQEPYEVGVSGSVQVLIFDAAEAALTISQSEGLRGEAHISYPPLALSGDASLHVWRSGDAFHFTGSAGVTVGFTKGSLYTQCVDYWVGETCVYIPPFAVTVAQISSEFGEFCENESCTHSVYGLKGSAEVLGWEAAFFIDASGSFETGDDAEEYALFDQATSGGLAATDFPLAPYTDTHSVEITGTDQALFILGWQQGAPSFGLIDPIGHRVDAELDPGIFYTRVVTSAYYVVDDPITGTWQIELGSLSGNEFYLLNVLGSNVPPSVTIDSVIPVDATTYTICWTASDPDDDPALALYYDTDDSGADGTLIAQGLDPAAGMYTWDASQIPTGDYKVYARIDDLKNAPVIGYYSGTVVLVDDQPPSAPTGLQAESPSPWTSILACWNRNQELDVVGYNVYYGRAPGTYGLGRIDATNLTCTSLSTEPGVDTYYLAVGAYDSSGNEGPLSEEREVTVLRLRGVYLPLLLRLSG